MACELSLDTYIISVVKMSNCHLHNAAKLRSVLSEGDADVLVHVCVISMLAYGNALFCGLADSTLQGLQSVQNSVG